MANRKYTFIDLFAGCGGLSEGFYRMGFKALAHIEINHWACETLRARMRYYGYKNIDKEVIEHDITAPDIINKIDEAVAGRIKEMANEYLVQIRADESKNIRFVGGINGTNNI